MLKNKVMYQPLIDLPPSDPETISLSMKHAQKLTAATGQKFVVYTVDQNLYRVVVHLQWNDSSAYKDVYL